jgi:hypothetical protein
MDEGLNIDDNTRINNGKEGDGLFYNAIETEQNIKILSYQQSINILLFTFRKRENEEFYNKVELIIKIYRRKGFICITLGDALEALKQINHNFYYKNDHHFLENIFYNENLEMFVCDFGVAL